VLFGFTSCPDYCPTTLADLRLALSSLGKQAERVQVVFVTVDPERDSRDALKKYLAQFDPTFIGLRGNVKETKSAAQDFRTLFQKKAGGQGKAYVVDHTTGVYVIDARGNPRLFASSARGERFLSDLRVVLANP